MRRRHYVIFAALLAAGLAGSLLLVTRGDELALIHFRDKDFAAALGDYEARLQGGDISAAVVMPLCQLYLQYGQVEAALSLMERFVRANPRDPLARRELARYYQYAQRQTEYFETLEELARLEPAEDTLRLLSEAHNFRGELDKQIAVLMRITQLYPGRPQDLIDVANLLAAQRRLREAATALETLHARHPASETQETNQFLLSVLLDDGQHDKAVQRAQSWLASHRDALVAARLASLLSVKGEPRAALTMLEPFAAAAATNPEVLANLVQLEVANGLRDRAIERLGPMETAGTLPAALLETYLDLLLTSGRAAIALEVATRRDLASMPSWVLISLTDAALASGSPDVAHQLVERLGDDFLEQDPVLGARLSLARRDSAGANRWVRAAEGRTLTAGEAMGLAQVYVALDRRAAAIDLLRPLVSDPSTPEAVVVDLANLYLESKVPQTGLAVFESLRTQRPSPEIDARWALLAVKGGRPELAVSWLKTLPPEQPPDDVLDDLYFLAGDQGVHALAVMAAERRWLRERVPARRLEFASALVAAGRVADALPHLRALLPGGTAEIEAGYVDALRAAQAAGAPVGDELRRYWRNKLAASGLDEKAREQIVYALLDLQEYDEALPALADLARRQQGQWLFAYADSAIKAGRTADLVTFLRAALDADTSASEAGDTKLFLLREHGGNEVALPYLRRFAETRGGEWVAAYEEALTMLGRRAERSAFRRSYASRRDVPAAVRRDIASRSLAEGERPLAESILLDLAENASPESPDVQQLLFLWGPRPQPSALDWLAARARRHRASARGVAAAPDQRRRASPGRDRGRWSVQRGLRGRGGGRRRPPGAGDPGCGADRGGARGRRTAHLGQWCPAARRGRHRASCLREAAPDRARRSGRVAARRRARLRGVALRRREGPARPLPGRWRLRPGEPVPLRRDPGARARHRRRTRVLRAHAGRH